MFTGLIESVGEVVSLAERPGGSLGLVVGTTLAAHVRAGDSVAVNGVCLTVTSADTQMLAAEVGPETLRVTTLGRLVLGEAVNLERAMRGDGRFGGHFVQGHVDAVGTVAALWDEAEAHWLSVAYPPAAAACLVGRGAVAVDGISLTVVSVRDDQFDVMIIPFTWEHTTIRSRRLGACVNLEYDILGKYVARAAELAGLTRHR